MISTLGHRFWTQRRLNICQAAPTVAEVKHSNRFHWFRLWDRYYQTSVVQFCHWLNVILAQRNRFTSTSFFFVAEGPYSRLLCEFFSVGNVSTFLSVKQMKITSFSNCFERLMIHMTADSANGRIEWWICDWSSWHSTSSSTVATFSSVFACMICCSVTAVGTSFENLYFKR